MKKLIVILAVFFIVVFSVGIMKDQIIKAVVTVVATEVTGAPVHIDGFSLGVFNRSIRITGLRIYNPKGFSKAILVELPKIDIKYDLEALLKKELHLAYVEVEIKEIGLEKDQQGKLNVDELKIAKQGNKQASKPSEQIPMQIDMLTLSMGRIVSKEYSAGGKFHVKVYDIDMKKSYKNVTSAQQLAALILVEPMKAAGLHAAGIYGVAALAGVAVLPVAAVVTFIGRDSAQQDFNSTFDNAYEKSLQVLKRQGRLGREDKARGIISATINSAQVNIKIVRKADNQVQVVVSARKYLFPKPEIAGGVLYGISEKLK